MSPIFDLNGEELSFVHTDVNTKYANLYMYVDILFFKFDQHLVEVIVGVREILLSELLLDSGHLSAL